MSRLWKSLSRGQRFCGVVLVVAVVVSVAWTLLGGANGPYQPLLETSLGEKSVELRALLSRFEKDKIDWKPSRVTDGRVTIEVRAGEDYQRAVFLAAEQGFDFGDSTKLDSGLFGSNLLSDSSDKLRMRLEHARVRTVERSIVWYSNVESVHLVIQRAKPSRYARETDKHDSAAVILRLKEGVSRLPMAEAKTIRKLVASAFTIAEEHIQVVDNSMRDYSATEEEPMEIESDDDLGARIKEVVTSLYRAIYDESEFRLGVLVDSSRKRGVDDSSTGNERASVRINLVLDVEAVKRVLAKRDLLLGVVPQVIPSDTLRQRLGEYEKEQAAFLGEQIPMRDVQVAVKSEVFQTVANVTNVLSLEELVKKGTKLGWTQLGLIYAGSFVAFLFLLWIFFGRRAPTAEDVTVDDARAPSDTVTRDTVTRGTVTSDAVTSDAVTSDAVTSDAVTSDAVNRDTVAIEARSSEACATALDASRRASTRSREQPKIAASVLRIWLSEISSDTDSETTDDRLSGARKAAVLLLSIDEHEAGLLLDELCDSEVQVLRGEFVSVGVIDQAVMSAVIVEFEELASSESAIGDESPTPVRATDEASRLLDRLRDEQPQTTAVVLAHVSPKLAASALAEMPEDRRVDLIQRIATLQGTHEEVLRRLEDSLRRVLDASPFVADGQERCGAHAAAEILRAGGESGRTLVESLARRDAGLARSISRRLFDFEDIAALDDRSLRLLLGEVDGAFLAVATSTTEKKIRSRIISGLTKREARALEARETSGRAFTLAEIEKARRSVTDTALRLEGAGDIQIAGVSSMLS